MQTSKRLYNFEELIFVSLAKKKREVEQNSGRKVLDFSLGSPDFPPSEKYIQKFQEFLKHPQAHMYPGWGGIPEFLQGLSNWHKKRFGYELANNEIYPVLGAREAVTHISLALLNEGDEVLFPNPGYVAYDNSALLINAKPVAYNLNPHNGYLPDYKELESKITDKTKMIWVNYPSNPLGAVMNLEQLQELVEFLKDKNIWLVYDNAYSEITFDGFIAPSVLQIPGAKDFAIELNTFSKAFSFAGFRMGWAIGNAEIIAALAKVKSHMDAGMSLPLQLLGTYALNNPDERWKEAMLASYETRRDKIAEKLKQIGLKFEMPKGALYLWAQIPDNYKNSEEYVFEMLEQKQILFTPGSAFGSLGDRFVRVSFCVNIDTIEEYF